jgi:hypothetical protein
MFKSLNVQQKGIKSLKKKEKKCFVSYILTTKKFEVNVNEFLVLYSKSLINVVSPFKYKKID